MDPFEVRMQFISLLRNLSASRDSIQKVVSYALKYFSRCGEDLWDCIVEQCQKGTINHRINILYFLDSLCETSLLAKAHRLPPPDPSSSLNRQLMAAGSSSGAGGASADAGSFYVDFVSRDLEKIVQCVVPEGRQGLPNLSSTKQILGNWRSKRVIDPHKIDHALSSLDARIASTSTSTSAHASDAPVARPPSHQHNLLPRNEVFKRIEEDRERHKRLRERRWVQSIPNPSPAHPSASALLGGASGLAAFLPLTEAEERELPLDVEFENEWETTSDWNEDDVEAVLEECETWIPGGAGRKDAAVQGTNGGDVGPASAGGVDERAVRESVPEELGEEPMDLEDTA